MIGLALGVTAAAGVAVGFVAGIAFYAYAASNSL